MTREDDKVSSMVGCIGLALVYTSAYFLPLLTPSGAYLFPSTDRAGLILAPSLAAVAIEAGLGYAALRVARRFLGPRLTTIGGILLLAMLATVALKGALDVAEVDWENRVPRGGDLLATLRYIKSGAFLACLGLVFATRHHATRWVRGLSSTGLAFGGYAAFRLMVLATAFAPAPATALAAPLPGGLPIQVAPGGAHLPKSDTRSRRVVWLILDEADFDRIYGPEIEPGLELSHFNWLAAHAVFARDAYSPASATLFSIPALLTGTALGSAGVTITRSGSLLVEAADHREFPFDEEHSIFGELRATGRSASLLGFYHPYCRLFALERCDDFSWPIKVGMSGLLWSNVPGVVAAWFGHADDWSSVTATSLRLLPEYLASRDALTFLHLNFPHLPAGYADRALQLPASQRPLTEYAHNLELSDQVLGRVIDSLRAQSSAESLLLVVSSDHWLRNRWYRPTATEESRRVPLIVWNVDETVAVSLQQPLSTVHTAAMIMAFLNGSITTQAEIGEWWASQPFQPPLIVPHT